MSTAYSPQAFIDYPYNAYSYEPFTDLSNKDKSFLSAAAKLAQTSDNRFKMACIAVRGGSVLGADINVTKLHPTTPPNRFSTHAEIGAINSCSDPSGATLYIARLKLDSSTAIARPCSWCMQYMLSQNIYRVVYTTDNYFIPEHFYLSTVYWNTNIL
jgi:tRNA(Arg) A34 adenosine deaminase TadA